MCNCYMYEEGPLLITNRKQAHKPHYSCLARHLAAAKERAHLSSRMLIYSSSLLLYILSEAFNHWTESWTKESDDQKERRRGAAAIYPLFAIFFWQREPKQPAADALRRSILNASAQRKGPFHQMSPKILLLARLKKAFVISNMLSCLPHGEAV